MRIVQSVVIAIVFAGGVLDTTSSGIAQTLQAYPAKPVRIVVGFSAGSTTDITARMMGSKLGEHWGQPVVVENRPGASGVLAANMVAKSVPDGYTLLLVSSAFAITAASQSSLPYDPLKDFAGVTQIGFPTAALVVAPALGVKSVKEFIAMAQDRPGKLLFGSAGAGSSTHINAERFGLAAGVKALHVGFKGQPEFIIEILAGRIQYGIAGLGPALPFIKDGRLLPLAVVTPQRSPMLPDVPAMAEILPGYERDGSHAVLAPAGTPRPILHQIGKDVARVLDLADVKERMQFMTFISAPTTPEEYDRILRAQIEAFSRVVRVTGLRSQ